MNKSFRVFYIFIGIFFIFLGINLFVSIPSFAFKPFGIVFITIGVLAVIFSKKVHTLNNTNRISSQEAKIEAGLKGEQDVAYALQWLDTNKYIVLNNININYNNSSQQFDHLAIGENGIFNIETKAYAGKITIDEYGNWSRENNGRTEALENPLFQVQRHEKILRKVLGESYPIIDVVVLARKDSLIEGIKFSPLHIIKVDALQYFIESFPHERKITLEELQKIKILIESSME